MLEDDAPLYKLTTISSTVDFPLGSSRPTGTDDSEQILRINGTVARDRSLLGSPPVTPIAHRRAVVLPVPGLPYKRGTGQLVMFCSIVR